MRSVSHKRANKASARSFLPSFILLASVFAVIGVSYSAPPRTLSVTLPDAGAYAYWVQSQSGVVSTLPVSITQKSTFALPAGAAAGGTLYILDGHTGEVATRPLSAAATALTLNVQDFRPITPASTPVSGTPSNPASSAPATNKPDVRQSFDAEKGIAAFFTWALGVAVAGCVVWFVLKLVQTRGEPLIALARKTGIDVPDPKPIDPNAPPPAPLYEPPKPRSVERVPDEAGIAPPTQSVVSGPSFGDIPIAIRSQVDLGDMLTQGSSPQLVGTQGLAAGSIFTLTEDILTVGRDGDNGIVLAEQTVSRRHAEIVRGTDGQFVLTDQGSANGVYINNERVQSATLVPGDEIKIGENFFRYRA